MDLFPTKAQFLTGEPVAVCLQTDGQHCEGAVLSIYHLEKLLWKKAIFGLSQNTTIPLGSFDTACSGYGVSVALRANDETVLLETSFDVVDHPKRSLRYGFVSDFAPEDRENGAMEWLCKCHINMVQYYDWSYRHDSLVAEQENYRDMMGKAISRNTVQEKIHSAKEYGMHSIAYGAVYAASRPFFENHQNWAFYNSNQQPFVFIDVFYIMNIQKGSPWRDHLISEYRKAIQKMGFSGIHMDTYGFPKTAFSHLGTQPEWVQLDQELPSLIAETRQKLADAATDPYLIFNNVGNWPTYSTASAPQDAVYIEVWDPYNSYAHIAQLIDSARAAAGDYKPIILAAYLKPFREESRDRAMNAAKIATAGIVSNGAYHLLLGENRAVLTQGYYSDYTRLSEREANTLRRYYDFMIRYMDLFYGTALRTVSMTHMGWDNYEYQCLSHPVSACGEAGTLWMIVREQKNRKCVSLVNLCGCGDAYWNRGKETPIPQHNVKLRIQVDFPVTGVYTASPDEPSLKAQAILCHETDNDKGRFIDVTLTDVKVWRTIWIDMKEDLK